VGKRQVRIFRKDLFLKKSEIQGQDAHVILSDQVVHHGQILSVTEQHLRLRNPRAKEMQLELAAVQEIVYDKETDY